MSLKNWSDGATPRAVAHALMGEATDFLRVELKAARKQKRAWRKKELEALEYGDLPGVASCRRKIGEWTIAEGTLEILLVKKARGIL